MKKILFFLSLILLGGCNNSDVNNEALNRQQINLTDDQRNESENLSLLIEFELSEVREFETAKYIEVTFIDFFDFEFLQASNGALIEKLQMLITLDPEPFIGSHRIIRNFGAFESFRDLSFKTFEEALMGVEKALLNLDGVNLGLAETYSIDLDNLLKQYELYVDVTFNGTFNAGFPNENTDLDTLISENEQWSSDDKEWLAEVIEWHQTLNWDKDDEAYLFFYRQYIDEIPIVNVAWRRGIQNNSMTPSLGVLYSKNGVETIWGNGFFKVLAVQQEVELINSEIALEQIVNMYRDISLSTTRLTSMELTYVVINEDTPILSPVWLIGGIRPLQTDFGLIDEYFFHVVNASTGEIIQ